MLQSLWSDVANPLTAVAWQTAILRLLAAAVLGGAIGFEREIHKKPAGLRTHMMIALASCLFTLLAFELMELPTDEREHLRVDPLRLIEAVTSGVAFLAAGTIISSPEKVKGLTTGAGMWMAGALGVACGLGQILLAVFGAVVALFVLAVLKFIEP